MEWGISGETLRRQNREPDQKAEYARLRIWEIGRTCLDGPPEQPQWVQRPKVPRPWCRYCFFRGLQGYAPNLLESAKTGDRKRPR